MAPHVLDISTVIQVRCYRYMIAVKFSACTNFVERIFFILVRCALHNNTRSQRFGDRGCGNCTRAPADARAFVLHSCMPHARVFVHIASGVEPQCEVKRTTYVGLDNLSRLGCRNTRSHAHILQLQNNGPHFDDALVSHAFRY